MSVHRERYFHRVFIYPIPLVVKYKQWVLRNLTWFIPALVNKRVGSSRGTTDEEWTYRCSFSLKKSTNKLRISDPVNLLSMAGVIFYTCNQIKILQYALLPIYTMSLTFSSNFKVVSREKSHPSDVMIKIEVTCRDTDVVDETVPPHTWLKVFTIKNMLLYIRPILLNDELQVGTWAEQWQLVLANSHISVQLEICT